jgi:hypothetical protein
MLTTMPSQLITHEPTISYSKAEAKVILYQPHSVKNSEGKNATNKKAN